MSEEKFTREMLYEKIKEKMKNYWEMYEVIEFLCRDCSRFRKPAKWRCRACRARRVLKKVGEEE